MTEYVPQWIVPSETSETPADGTAKTDRRAFVSFGSGPPTDAARNLARLGLDPSLQWMAVYRGPVEASRPPDNWEGIAPAGCDAPIACRILGPCRHFIDHGRCWKACS